MIPSKNTVIMLEGLGVDFGIGFSVLCALAVAVAAITGWPIAWVVVFASSFISVAGYTLASAMNVVRRML